MLDWDVLWGCADGILPRETAEYILWQFMIPNARLSMAERYSHFLGLPKCSLAYLFLPEVNFSVVRLGIQNFKAKSANLVGKEGHFGSQFTS